MNYLKLALAGLIIFTLGAGIGYYFAPSKTKTETKTDDKRETDTKTTETKKYDPNTGKLIEDTITKEKNDKKESSTDKIKITEKSQKHYALKAGAVMNPRNLNGSLTPRVGGEMALPFFNTWIGVEGDVNVKNPLLGIYGRIEF